MVVVEEPIQVDDCQHWKVKRAKILHLHGAMLTATFQSNAFQFKCISVEISRPSREVIQLIVVQCAFPDSKARQGEDKQRLAGGWSPSIVSCQRKPEKLLLSREGRGSHWQIAFLSFYFVFQSQWLNHVCQQNHGFICLKSKCLQLPHSGGVEGW